MAAKKNEILKYEGIITYNTISLYANNTKKRFTGFIKMIDANQNEASYKINSFRTQVIYQSDILGERGMAGKKIIVHGYFKENSWNGKTTMELMAEKIYIIGMEKLADDAEKSETALPIPPVGGLPQNTTALYTPPVVAQPIAHQQPLAQPTLTVPSNAAPVETNSVPAAVSNAYVYNPAASQMPQVAPTVPITQMPQQQVSQAPQSPQAVSNAYVYNPATVAPIMQTPVAQQMPHQQVSQASQSPQSVSNAYVYNPATVAPVMQTSAMQQGTAPAAAPSTKPIQQKPPKQKLNIEINEGIPELPF